MFIDTFILPIHTYNIIVIGVVALITCIWGFVLYFRKLTMNRSWIIALIVSGILGAFQGLLGIILVLSGHKPGTGTGLYYLHYVYGGIVALVLPVALTYTTSGKNQRRDILVYSLAVLILVAAAIRAWMTGPA